MTAQAQDIRPLPHHLPRVQVLFALVGTSYGTWTIYLGEVRVAYPIIRLIRDVGGSSLAIEASAAFPLISIGFSELANEIHCRADPGDGRRPLERALPNLPPFSPLLFSFQPLTVTDD